MYYAIGVTLSLFARWIDKTVIKLLELNKVYCGDCLEIMKNIDDKSVNLAILDLPYNIKKDKWDKINNYEEWVGEVLIEVQRVLAENGSLYFFHNKMSVIAHLMNWIENNTKFVFKNLITISKLDESYIKKIYGSQNHFRNYINNSEYILFYTFQDDTGLTTVKLDLNNFTPLRKYFKELQEYLELSLKQITNKMGDRKTEHAFYWKTTQWDLPTEETYNKLIDVFQIDQWKGFREYESLRREYESLRREYESLRREYESLRREYESLRYTFNKTEGETNVWHYFFKREKQYNHSTQKPLKLLESIILYSSNENDIILDPTCGSGSTLMAAKNLNRKFIGIEKEQKYCDMANKRLDF